jgi:hypothetical protein
MRHRRRQLTVMPPAGTTMMDAILVRRESTKYARTLVAPSATVRRHDGLDPQRVSLFSPLSCYVAGVKPACMVLSFC